MAYLIDVDDNERFSVNFIDEPSYIRGLKMAPKSCEQELFHGNWLVLLFAIWNAHDRPAIDLAVAVSKNYQGQFSLAVRPFELAEESQSWLSSLEITPTTIEVSEIQTDDNVEILLNGSGSSTPMWLWLREGRVLSHRNGLLNEAELRDFIEDNLNSEDGKRGRM